MIYTTVAFNPDNMHNRNTRRITALSPYEAAESAGGDSAHPMVFVIEPEERYTHIFRYVPEKVVREPSHIERVTSP